MHGELRLKIVNAKQAELVHRYKNIKIKLLKSNAAIWFNKVCRSEQLTPSYIDIKISGNNERSHKTKNAATHDFDLPNKCFLIINSAKLYECH
jgi:hypothetical protein